MSFYYGSFIELTQVHFLLYLYFVGLDHATLCMFEVLYKTCYISPLLRYMLCFDQHDRPVGQLLLPATPLDTFKM